MVYKSNFTIVYGIYNYSTGAYKPTYNVWGPHIARLAMKMRPSLQLSERQMITWLVLAPGMIIKLLSFNNPGAPKKY
jgi:hypothetical protein